MPGQEALLTERSSLSVQCGELATQTRVGPLGRVRGEERVPWWCCPSRGQGCHNTPHPCQACIPHDLVGLSTSCAQSHLRGILQGTPTPAQGPWAATGCHAPLLRCTDDRPPRFYRQVRSAAPPSKESSQNTQPESHQASRAYLHVTKFIQDGGREETTRQQIDKSPGRTCCTTEAVLISKCRSHTRG